MLKNIPHVSKTIVDINIFIMAKAKIDSGSKYLSNE